jgi:hypothetical protein
METRIVSTYLLIPPSCKYLDLERFGLRLMRNAGIIGEYV